MGGIGHPCDTPYHEGGVIHPCDVPIMGGVQPITVNQLQTLISIHLHWFLLKLSIHLHWFLLKILGISMIFRGWSVVGSGGEGWSRSKEKKFLQNIYTHLLTVNV